MGLSEKVPASHHGMKWYVPQPTEHILIKKNRKTRAASAWVFCNKEGSLQELWQFICCILFLKQCVFRTQNVWERLCTDWACIKLLNANLFYLHSVSLIQLNLWKNPHETIHVLKTCCFMGIFLIRSALSKPSSLIILLPSLSDRQRWSVLAQPVPECLQVSCLHGSQTVKDLTESHRIRTAKLRCG